MHIVTDYLEVVFSFILFFANGIFFNDFIFYKSEIRTVLLEVIIVIGLLKDFGELIRSETSHSFDDLWCPKK